MKAAQDLTLREIREKLVIKHAQAVDAIHLLVTSDVSVTNTGWGKLEEARKAERSAAAELFSLNELCCGLSREAAS